MQSCVGSLGSRKAARAGHGRQLRLLHRVRGNSGLGCLVLSHAHHRHPAADGNAGTHEAHQAQDAAHPRQPRQAPRGDLGRSVAPGGCWGATVPSRRAQHSSGWGQVTQRTSATRRCSGCSSLKAALARKRGLRGERVRVRVHSKSRPEGRCTTARGAAAVQPAPPAEAPASAPAARRAGEPAGCAASSGPTPRAHLLPTQAQPAAQLRAHSPEAGCRTGSGSSKYARDVINRPTKFNFTKGRAPGARFDARAARAGVGVEAGAPQWLR